KSIICAIISQLGNKIFVAGKASENSFPEVEAVMIRRVEDLDLRDRTVFLRVDFNVPIEQGRITETHRIESALPTIRLILDRAKKLVVGSHLGRPDGKGVTKHSLRPVRRL